MIQRFSALSPEARYRLLVKCVVALLFAALVFSDDRGESWPLAHWTMFSSGEPFSLNRASTIELHVVDTDGGTHLLRSYDLYSLDDDGSWQNAGYSLVYWAFSDTPPQNPDIWRFHLGQRASAVIGKDAAEIQGWQSVWTVHPTRYPLITVEEPDDYRLAGRFRPADYASDPPDLEPDLTFAGEIDLLAHIVPGGTQAHPCDTLYVRTWWRASQPPSGNYHVTLALTDSTGVGRTSQDSILAGDFTRTWQAGQIGLDRKLLEIPCDLPAGDYNLLVSLYTPDPVENLPITFPPGYDSYAPLTTVQIMVDES